MSTSNIGYNSLNLPKSLTISNSTGSATNAYVYDANGTKLSVSKGGSRTDYVGNVIYENGSLKRILVDGGYNEGGVYYFYITDHLGNNRIVANQNAGVIQTTDYHPFGMAFADGTGQDTQPYKYNGKELDNGCRLNLYDYSARYMDPALGRFTTMDPMAEKYYAVSPYAYCANNPMRFVDPTGMFPEEEESLWQKIIRAANNLFSIKIDTSSEEAKEETVRKYNQQLETIENITEGVETVNTGMAVILPASSVVELGAAIYAGASTEAVAVAATSVVIDVTAGGKGKAVTQFISLSDIKRIENAASRIGKTIYVVGSRAVPGKVKNGINMVKGTPADWDYAIEGMTHKEWKKLKNSLPGAKSSIDNTPRNIDIVKELDKSKSHIPIHPKKK